MSKLIIGSYISFKLYDDKAGSHMRSGPDRESALPGALNITGSD
ncbi:hypothetical protein [Parafilimonas sp.]